MEHVWLYRKVEHVTKHFRCYNFIKIQRQKGPSKGIEGRGPLTLTLTLIFHRNKIIDLIKNCLTGTKTGVIY